MAYETVLTELETGTSPLFISGKGGSGKTELIKSFVANTARCVLVLATTGRASAVIGGISVHSAFHFKPSIVHTTEINQYEFPPNHPLRHADTIIIDEASLLRSDVFDGMDKMLQIVRGNSQPFGGVRIVLVGDLWQLPPVVTPEIEPFLIAKYGRDNSSYFFFDSHVFRTTQFHSELKYFELVNNYRQKDEDESFLAALDCIRFGNVDDWVLSRINSGLYSYNNEIMPIITAKREEAQRINTLMTFSLPGELRQSIQIIHPELAVSDSVVRDHVLNRLLILKENMQIMFVKNDTQRPARWHNGTSGRIVKINMADSNTIDSLLIESSDMQVEVARETVDVYRPIFDFASNRISIVKVAQITQFPIIPAWATTVHRCQSITLDAAIIDLGGSAFTSGQTYTALTRVRKESSYHLTRPLIPKDIIVSDSVIQFMQWIGPRIEYSR